jgi:hypothetical protein
VAWFWVVVSVVVDIFRNEESSGFQKAFWVLFVIVLPWLGVLVYLIAQGDHMSERSVAAAARKEQAAHAYIRNAAGTPTAADELEKLASLHATAGVGSRPTWRIQPGEPLGSDARTAWSRRATAGVRVAMVRAGPSSVAR